MNQITETTTNIIAEGTKIEGKVTVNNISRIHGIVTGQISGVSGSTVIICETAVVEGDVVGETVMINGYVRGNVVAAKKVVISGTGRVVGNIKSPSLSVDFGAYFDGQSSMENRSEAFA